MQLIRDVLDKQLVSIKAHDPMGMADGVVLELQPGQAPRVTAIECGFPVLARRLHPRLEPLVRSLGRRFGIRKGRIYRIPWFRVKSVGIEIVLDLDADRSPATAWERWLRSYLPGHNRGTKR